MPFGKHIFDMRNLMELNRYQNKFRFKKRSVAEHMWSVAKIAQGLAIWEERKFLNPVDMGLLLQRAINHDVIEYATGDIIATTKKRTQDMKKALHEIESLAYDEEIKQDLPRSWQERFRGYILNPKENDVEGAIIAAADIIDTILEAVEEIKLGNMEFRPILVEVSELLMEIDLECVRYFLKFALHDFGLDIETFYGKKVMAYINTLSYDEVIFERV